MYTFNDYLEQWAGRIGGSPAVADAEQELTYSMLLCKVRELQGYLHSRGLREGDVVGISAPRCVSLVLLYVAALGLGLSVVPLPEQAAEIRLQQILSLIPVNVLIQYEGYSQPGSKSYVMYRIRPAKDGYIKETDRTFIPYQLSDSYAGYTYSPSEANASYYNLTSGSTGGVKAVRTGSREIIMNALLVSERLPLNTEDCYCCLFAPDMHPHELFARPLLFGARCLLVANHELRSFGHHMREHRLTHLLATPHTLSNLLKICQGREDWQGIKFLLGTGENVPYDLRFKFYNRTGKKLISVWGCTETTGIVLVMPEASFLEEGTILGLPVPGYELIIEPGSGELLIRGDSVMKGYWNYEEQQPVDQNGYYHTGDTVTCNADGVLTFTGRTDSFIKAAGRRISLHELEQQIGSLPGIVEIAAVYSDVSHTVGIFYSANSESSRMYPDILQLLNDALTPTKFRVMQCAGLPKLTSGKINKKELEAKLE
ncbi:class I adenylate-forming enzyme family protein [Paenibacillus camerounensis]|uniref:class I adenylate-forming enzyme family protein n=1 Tax=Paenibacillus camerounensis TaxID=1243663 RepID=UPI0005AA8D25|nr:class I adenylate-forming enzyme family protein [Paenibacillus camerounensis]